MTNSGKVKDRLKSEINEGKNVILEIGCGRHKRHPEAIGIDIIDYHGVDIVGDILEVTKEMPDDIAKEIYSYHCFEHLTNLPEIIEQLSRIMIKNATMLIVVPHFSNPYYYSDYTHKNQFGLYSFSYLTNENLFSRRCPNYLKRYSINLENVKLIFKSPPPFYFRWGIKRIIQYLVNINKYSLEFYEENLCWIIPCYEIEFKLRKI